MPLNLSKTLLMLSASILLVAATATSSDARQQARQQSGADSYRSDYNSTRDRDSSCFSRSTGIPTEFACSVNGG